MRGAAAHRLPRRGRARHISPPPHVIHTHFDPSFPQSNGIKWHQMASIRISNSRFLASNGIKWHQMASRDAAGNVYGPCGGGRYGEDVVFIANDWLGGAGRPY